LKFKIDLSSFQLQYILDGNKKIIKITLKYYIKVNKIYLYNYSDKIKHIIMSHKMKIII